MLVGRRQEEERKREDDDERGVCWLRLLLLSPVAVPCCRSLGDGGWRGNRGGGGGSISECAMGRGMGMCFEGRKGGKGGEWEPS